MKILYLLGSNKFSGAENVVCTIIDVLGDKIDALYCSPNGPIQDSLKERNINYYGLEKLSVRELRKVIKDFAPDIIHANDYRASVIAALSGFKGEIISHLHNNDPLAKTWNIKSIPYSITTFRYNKIIGVSNKVLEEAIFKKQIENKYTIYIDDSDVVETSIGSYIAGYLDLYNRHLGDEELYRNDLSPELIYNNFEVETKSITGEEMSDNAMMLKMIMGIAFTYIIMAIVMSSTNMATSATAVEKENGTMETLLTFPIKVHELVLGKYLATAIVGLISSLVGLVLTILSLVIAVNYFNTFKDISFNIGVVNISLSILIVILASLFIAGVSILVTSKTKSFKEAQSVSSVLSLVSIIPMMVSLMDISISNIYYFIPILNYTQILMDIFSPISFPFSVNVKWLL